MHSRASYHDQLTFLVEVGDSSTAEVGALSTKRSGCLSTSYRPTEVDSGHGDSCDL